MDIRKAREIIKRKSTIPIDGETFDDISQSCDIAAECMEYRIKKEIKPRKCNSCEQEECVNCNDNFNRCPSCNESLDDDYGSEPNFCENCGQALIWYTEDGFALRN